MSTQRKPTSKKAFASDTAPRKAGPSEQLGIQPRQGWQEAETERRGDRREISEESRARARGDQPASVPHQGGGGYGRPPLHSRFKRGQSGNPGGRPRGSKNVSGMSVLAGERLNGIILEEAYSPITVTDANGRRRIPLVQAVVRSIGLKAAKGDARAQRQFTELVGSIERENKRSYDAYAKAMIEYKADWERELEERKRLGVEGPVPVPHPDDIVIDPHTGLVGIKGPCTKEDKVVWDRVRARKEGCDQDIAENQQLLKTEEDARVRDVIIEEIEREKKLRARLCEIIPD